VVGALVAVVLAAVAGVLLVRSSGLSGIPEDTMLAALGAATADFSADGSRPGPPGSKETWSVYTTQIAGVSGPSWVYIDDRDRVRRVDNFSAGTLRPSASDTDAVDAAKAYVSAVKGPPLEGLVMRPVSSTPGRPTTVAWQKKQSDAWIPTGVSVLIGGDGKVVGYQWIDTPVTVSLEPDVTAGKAAARARRQLGLDRVRKTTHALEVLALDLENDGKAEQHLVWSLAFSLRGQEGPPGALAIVDAQTGKVLSAARMTL